MMMAFYLHSLMEISRTYTMGANSVALQLFLEPLHVQSTAMHLAGRLARR